MTTDQLINRIRREAMTPEQKLRQAEADKKWRLANPEQARKIHANYYARNREAILAKHKARNAQRKQA
jgi:hypothetical protein